MTESTTYFKWIWELFPNEKSRQRYNLPEVERIVSKKTYTSLEECSKAAYAYEFDMPCCYGGPQLRIVCSKEWKHMEEIYEKHMNF